MAGIVNNKNLVFGLDIGTRSIVGTVGYKEGDKFYVVAQRSKEHETRAMIDGQIHDIGKVGETIKEVKNALEEAVETKLQEVCIAAAGRVLRTVTTSVEQEFSSEREIKEEDVYALSAMGVEKAYEEFVKSNDTDMAFYCVGYSAIRFYMNHYPMGNLVGHKAKVISAEYIVTFLPEDVVDGLYKAVELADLHVANLTLEPIAAIQVAIPEMYRMLNIALVDVGAGTSDISITKDGAIIAYGMIPVAGDSLTEVLAQHCLVDFATAEEIKRNIGVLDDIPYKDIMGLPQTITTKDAMDILNPYINKMTSPVAQCIRELNGDKSVSAVFVVGGGGKIPTYTQLLAEELGIVKERVALRGEEVMNKIVFLEETKKDSLLVTPIGICLTFYEQSNNFIFVTFNEKRVKVYDNGSLAVVDVAMAAQFPNDGLFPKRGKELNYTVNGKARITRGLPGEAATIFVNGQEADIHTKIRSNDIIVVNPSTAGDPAKQPLSTLPEFSDTLQVQVNGKKVVLPKFAAVDGQLRSGFYEIQEGDQVEMLSYYTVEQILQFMDVQLAASEPIYVNNNRATMKTPVYENFQVIFGLEAIDTLGGVQEAVEQKTQPEESAGTVATQKTSEATETAAEVAEAAETTEAEVVEEAVYEETFNYADGLTIIVNKRPITMRGKNSFVFVDVFDYINFDLNNPKGKGIVTNLNGQRADYMATLHPGDVIEIYWQE